MLLCVVLSSFASDMLIYDEGNVYSCPSEHHNYVLEEVAGYELDFDEGKAYQIDPISHLNYEDMFYDALACRPFYQDSEAPIWYGRIDGLTAANQKIFVYGFVTSPMNENYEG